MAKIYEVDVTTMNDPARSLKAFELPKVMAPKAVVRTPVKIVAGMGQLRRSFALAKNFENGVALSRASAQYVRPT